MNWLTDPANSSVVGGIGLATSVVGTALTLVGLLITYLQAKKASSAAAAATQAVKDFRFRIDRHDAARDIAEAEYALNQARKHLRNTAWKDVVDSYDDAQRAVVRIVVFLEASDFDKVDELKKMAAQIVNMCGRIEKAISNQAAFPDSQKLNAAIRNNYTILISLRKFLSESA
ncbi:MULTISPECIES: hypothetical protein [unclassified Sphingobium]|uniref:hypothetical protein n=1 Tax=unclassified Sphingobium TaxID=2611147 RepID=UPI0022251CD0|nr:MULTISPECIES: hypothetical protein [unclassified Sphingobium]MCW2380984.1 hypothetical protein [Sphingobium sp. B2D3B]MCW2388874.1 hypothetical protein [Sphingobium sp. B11D3B]MCW2398910.1 hypothetical protein [Sphingobium sp. B2D3C]